MKPSAKRIGGALGLLTLFIAFQASIMAFAHVHYVNGVYIAHSHPYQDSHQHTSAQLLVIGQLSHYDVSPQPVSVELRHPLRPLLAVLAPAAAIPMPQGIEVRIPSLRAPPAHCFILS